MKHRTRILQIAGFKGTILLLFVASCLAAGFIVFPAISMMYLWNYISLKTSAIPMINFVQGLLLWAGIAISLYLLNQKNKYLFAVTTKRELTEEEVKKLINRIRMQRTQAYNPMMLKSSEIKPTDTKSDDKEKENV